MPVEVIMPALGMAQETGKVVRWHKAEGDAVTKGEPLLEIETDKVTVDIEAPADGTLAGIRAANGVGQLRVLRRISMNASSPAGGAVTRFSVSDRAGPKAKTFPLSARPS